MNPPNEGAAWMPERYLDGSAGDVDYAAIGRTYCRYRQPEPFIEALIARALGSARSVLNVGAGAGSYEPTDREVTAIEPSASMRAQRPQYLTPAIDAVAERLPFPDQTFDTSMTTFSVHQWTDAVQGLREMRRVTRGVVVVLSCDPREVQRFWLNDFAPAVLAAEARRYPELETMTRALGGEVEIWQVPIPFDCRDGFNEAYYGRPEMLLDQQARLACSAWSFLDAAETAQAVEKLRAALADGAWDAAHGHLRRQPFFGGSLRLIVGHPRTG